MTIEDRKRLDELKYLVFKIEDYLIDGDQSERVYKELVEAVEALSEQKETV